MKLYSPFIKLETTASCLIIVQRGMLIDFDDAVDNVLPLLKANLTFFLTERNVSFELISLLQIILFYIPLYVEGCFLRVTLPNGMFVLNILPLKLLMIPLTILLKWLKHF